MRRLAAVGITTREACGNTVRNVTACPLSGVCRDQAFDITPYAKACGLFFCWVILIARTSGARSNLRFRGCETNPCALVRIHDLGVVAKVREIDGKMVRGFATYVGGGLGTVPLSG